MRPTTVALLLEARLVAAASIAAPRGTTSRRRVKYDGSVTSVERSTTDAMILRPRGPQPLISPSRTVARGSVAARVRISLQSSQGAVSFCADAAVAQARQVTKASDACEMTLIFIMVLRAADSRSSHKRKDVATNRRHPDHCAGRRVT